MTMRLRVAPEVNKTPLPVVKNEFFDFRTKEEVDPLGLQKVSFFLAKNHANRDLPQDFDPAFENKQGRFSRRVSAHYYKTYGIKLDEKMLTTVGNIANDHTVRQDIVYDFTTTFDWNSGDFGDSGSCFWGSKSEARDLIGKAGGCAIRLFDFKNTERPQGRQLYQRGVGRAWVLPVGLVNPKTQKLEFYPVVFNAYCKREYPFQLRDFAVIVGSYMQGIRNEEYIPKDMYIENMGSTSATLYLNGGKGFLVAPKHVCEHYSNIDFQLDRNGNSHAVHEDPYFQCNLCNREWYGEGIYVRHLESRNHAGLVCQECHDEHIMRCPCCSDKDRFHRKLAVDVVTNEREARVWCPRCADARTMPCAACGIRFSIKVREGTEQLWLQDQVTQEYFCFDCAEQRKMCSECHRVVGNDNIKELDDQPTCIPCWNEIYDNPRYKKSIYLDPHPLNVMPGQSLIEMIEAEEDEWYDEGPDEDVFVQMEPVLIDPPAAFHINQDDWRRRLEEANNFLEDYNRRKGR